LDDDSAFLIKQKKLIMKKSKQSIAVTLHVSAEATWKVIGGIEGVDQWLAPITDCRVEGSKRICTTEDGSFIEDILKIDHENRLLKYAIPKQHMMPVENIIGHMQVKEDGGNARVEWSWEFDVEESRESEAKEMLAMVGNMGLNGIQSLIQNKQATVA